MDGISNVVGVKTAARTFNGREYRFKLKVLANHAEKEAHILGLKPSPFEVMETLPATLPEQSMALIVDRLVKESQRPQFVTRFEEVEFDASLHGLAWGLWRAMRDQEFDFGKLKKDEDAVYETPDGTGYSMKPAQGVQRALDFIEEVGTERIGELEAIRDGVENPPELKNSSGSVTTTEPSPQATSDSPGPN